MAATEPIRSKEQVRELSLYYLNRGEIRNHVFIVMGLHTALRVSDLLRIGWNDVYDFGARRFRREIRLTEKKTGKETVVALHDSVIDALKRYARAAAPGRPLFASPRTGKAISRVQAYRITRDAGGSLSCPLRVSCHSLRKTFGYHAWKSGVSPAIIMDLYNHSSMLVTKRYLGVTQDDKNAVYLGMAY